MSIPASLPCEFRVGDEGAIAAKAGKEEAIARNAGET